MQRWSLLVLKLALPLALALAAAVTSTHMIAAQERSASVAKDSRCFEMRTYTAAPGKAEALHKRFRDHTLKLFQRHGMTNVGYWVPTDRPDTIVYILAYPSRAAREESWKAFGADPEWQAAKKASEDATGGSLTTKVESVFMESTDYSPIK
jgi:hypothetical protein